MPEFADAFDHHVHLKTSREHPNGRNVWVYIDGKEFHCEGVNIDFAGDSLNLVTIKFVARLTTEEIEDANGEG